MTSGEKVQTIFNSAIAQLESIRDQLDEATYYSKRAKFKGFHLEYLNLWRDTILAVTREVFPKFNKQEKNEVLGLFKKIGEIKNVLVDIKTQEGTYKTIDSKQFVKKWIAIHKFDSKVRQFADDHGLFNPNRISNDSPMDA